MTEIEADRSLSTRAPEAHRPGIRSQPCLPLLYSLGKTFLSSTWRTCHKDERSTRGSLPRHCHLLPTCPGTELLTCHVQRLCTSHSFLHPTSSCCTCAVTHRPQLPVLHCGQPSAGLQWKISTVPLPRRIWPCQVKRILSQVHAFVDSKQTTLHLT